MSYAIARVEKRKRADVIKMQYHNEREYNNHSNEDINKELTKNNYDLIACDDYGKAIFKQIKNKYHYKRAIRKDAVVCTEMLFTSDTDFFERIGEEKEKIYFEKCLEFAQEKFGKENVISAKVHKDEKTPHLHLVFVPLHENGDLSFTQHFDKKKDYIKFQDDFFAHISKEFPELERGMSAKETGTKHLDVKEFKKQKNKEILEEIKELDKEIDKQEKYCLELEKTKDENEKFLKELEEKNNKITEEIKFKKEKYNSNEDILKDWTEDISEQFKKYEKLKEKFVSNKEILKNWTEDISEQVEEKEKLVEKYNSNEKYIESKQEKIKQQEKTISGLDEKLEKQALEIENKIVNEKLADKEQTVGLLWHSLKREFGVEKEPYTLKVVNTYRTRVLGLSPLKSLSDKASQNNQGNER